MSWNCIFRCHEKVFNLQWAEIEKKNVKPHIWKVVTSKCLEFRLIIKFISLFYGKWSNCCWNMNTTWNRSLISTLHSSFLIQLEPAHVNRAAVDGWLLAQWSKDQWGFSKAGDTFYSHCPKLNSMLKKKKNTIKNRVTNGATQIFSLLRQYSWSIWLIAVSTMNISERCCRGEFESRHSR